MALCGPGIVGLKPVAVAARGILTGDLGVASEGDTASFRLGDLAGRGVPVLPVLLFLLDRGGLAGFPH